MDFLLITIGSHGDVHPFVGLGIRLMERGHRVRLITNAHFEPLVRSAGIEFIELGKASEYLELASRPELWNPRRAFFTVFGEVMRSLEAVYETIQQHLSRQTVVASSSLCLGARIAQDKLRFPHATIHLAPGVFRSEYEPPKLPGLFMPSWLPRTWKRAIWALGDRLVLDPFIGPRVNAFRVKLGLPPIRHVVRDWWHSPTMTIGMFPDWFAEPQPDWPPQLRLTGFPLYDERGIARLSRPLQNFLSGGETPIAFTPGSAMFHGGPFFEAAVDACRRLGRRGILLSRHAKHIPVSLPPGVIHADYVPFSELLPQVAALVHHGGIGTSAQAMAAGVPQLVTPICHDQLDNAERMRRLGVARTIPMSRFNGRRGARLLGLLTGSDAVSAACGNVAGRFPNLDGLGSTCDALESLAPHPQHATLAAS
jgi:rhamnosyltransferase subunit B